MPDPEPLASLDAATLHAGRAAGILDDLGYLDGGGPILDRDRLCELHALVSIASGLSAVATRLAERSQP